MTSVETAGYLWRIDEMLKAPAVAYGISVEPLLGPITLPERFLNLGKSSKT
jgi:protein gp37